MRISIKLLTTLFAIALGTLTLSAQENIITPAPVRVQGGICVDGYCAPAEPFDFRQTLKLNISGADKADAERLEAAVSAAGLDFKRVKQHAKSGFISINIFPECMEQEDGYVILTYPYGVDITAQSAAGAFYALQSVRQMVEAGEWQTGVILDYPRFE